MGIVRGVEQSISSHRLGDHLCCIYENETQQRHASLRFLIDGLAQGCRVFLGYSAFAPDALLQDLKSAGVDGESALARGQLVFSGGVFDPSAAPSRINADTLQALAEGYSGLFWASEMSWAAREPSASRLAASEAQLENQPCAAILCLYDRRLCDPMRLIDVLLTHPKGIIGAQVYENACYLPPQACRGMDRGEARLNQWLSALTGQQPLLQHIEHRSGSNQAAKQRTRVPRRKTRQRQQMKEALAAANAALARANADLRESEERCGVLVNQSPVCIMVIQESHFVFVNPAGASRLGYEPAEEMIGLPVIDAVSPESCNQMVEWMRVMDQVATKEPILIEFQSRGDARVLFESSSVPIHYQGRPAALVIGQDITERTRYAQQLETSLAEKEVMLREIHHRVKNNLNVIIALIDLQKSTQTDPQVQQVFKELQTRAYSMALVHESLYRTPNLASVDFSGYLHTLTDHLSAAYQSAPGGVQVVVEAEKVALKIETAISCGLIVNELVTNALKYAFPPSFQQLENQPNQILVRLERDPSAPNMFCLTVQDNGVGMPPGMDWRGVATLGLQLVQVLSQQLVGKMALENNRGVTWRMRFIEWR